MEKVKLAFFLCDDPIGTPVAVTGQSYASGIENVYALFKAVMAAVCMTEQRHLAAVLVGGIYQHVVIAPYL